MTSTVGFYGDPMNEKIPERVRTSTCFMCLQVKEHAGVLGIHPLCPQCYMHLKDVMCDKRNKELIRLKMKSGVKK